MQIKDLASQASIILLALARLMFMSTVVAVGRCLQKATHNYDSEGIAAALFWAWDTSSK